MTRGWAAPALAAALALGGPAWGQPVELVPSLPEGEDVAVLDIRSEAECLSGSLRNARCLPAAWMISETGDALIGFHALRWLFGTVGLTGRETLALYAGPEGPTQDAWALGALAYLAGQAEVVLLAGEATGRNGWQRNENREAVYTAPIRVAAMTVDGGDTPLRDQLADFARGRSATVAFAPNS